MVTIYVDDQCCGQISPMLHGQFIEVLGGCIYDGIWVGETSHIPNVKGIRKDFVEAMKKIAPPVIRWPGGCYADTYHWRNGIGPRADRPVTFNENFGTFELDTNQFGTHEFVDLCRMVGAKPWINVNLLSGSVDEMKTWMEYCNREEDTTLKKEREKNGSAEAFHVEYWGIGNEPWAGGGNYTPHGYCDAYRRYATAAPSFKRCMTDPPEYPIKLIACGPDGNKPTERVAWTQDFFKELGRYRKPPVDGYDLHFYNWNVEQDQDTDRCFDEDGWYRVIESCFELDTVIKEQYELIQEGLSQFDAWPGPVQWSAASKCDLVVGEWGNWHGSSFTARSALFQQVTMRDAITTALTLDIFHQNCSRVKMACVAQTVNVLNALFLTDGQRFIKTPNYDVFEMYKIHRDAQLLSLRKIDQEVHEGRGRIYPLASLKDGVIHLNIVNTDYSRSEHIVLVLPWRCIGQSASILCADSPGAYNSWESPDRIRAKDTVPPYFDGQAWHMQVPAASVSVYQFQIA